MTGLLSLSTCEEWEKRQARHPQKSGAIGRRPYSWSEHLQIHLKESNMNCHVAGQWLQSNAQHWKWRVSHYRIGQIPQAAIDARVRSSAGYQHVGVKTSNSLKEGFPNGAGNNSNRRLGPNCALQVGDALNGALPFLRLNLFFQAQLNGRIAIGSLDGMNEVEIAGHANRHLMGKAQHLS